MAKDDQRISRRLPITDAQKQILFTILVRKKTSFLMAKEQLQPEHFGKGDQGYAMVWAAVLAHYSEMGRLPREDELATELDRRIRDVTDALDDAELREMDRFVRIAYATQTKVLSAKLAAKFLRMYMEDRLADQARNIFHLSGRNPSDIFNVARELVERATSIQAISGTGVEAPFPAKWDEQAAPVEKWDTGLAFLNTFLNGGDSPGEVNGLMGPYGSAKTSTGIQLSTYRAEVLYREWDLGGRKGPMPLVYYFYYEGSMAEMRVRALSCVGEIDRGVLETNDWDNLSYNRETLKPYERELFKARLAQHATVWPEKSKYKMLCSRCGYTETVLHAEEQRCPECRKRTLGYVAFPVVYPEKYRKKRAEIALNRNWRPIDMTGNDPLNPGRGAGLVDEIVAIIRQNQLFLQGRGELVATGSVYIDYLLAMADSYITQHGLKKKDELRFLVKSVPLHLKNRVALAFRCPVWILHQLSSESNALAPGIIPKITDSAEGKGFAENLDFCFQYGNKTDDSLFAVDCGKHRRSAAQPEAIARLVGQLAVVRDTNGRYTIDTTARKIVKKEDYNKIERGAKPHRPSANYNDARTQASD
jgi:hypothetical protein